MTYDLRQIAADTGQHTKGAEVVLPPIEERLGTVKAYRTALGKVLRGIATEVRTGILPAYKEERKQAALVKDGPSDFFRKLVALRQALTAAAERSMERILRLEAERHTDRFIDATKRALGIDLTAVVRAEGIEAAVQVALERNVSLIGGLTDDTIRAVEQQVYIATANGHSVGRLREDIQKRLGIAARRADLIAQDQVSKLNSDLNRIRQTEAGVTNYEWRTSRDERVRPLHKGLDKKVYEWGKPTGAEGGLPPGQPVRCRCVALGVVVF